METFHPLLSIPRQEDKDCDAVAGQWGTDPRVTLARWLRVDAEEETFEIHH
jgi:hypothetical protein